MKVNPTGFWTDVAEDEHVYSQAIVDWMAAHLPFNLPVYDFGCGAGGYLQQLSNRGFKDLSGFEGDPKCAKLASGLTVYQQDLTKRMYCPEQLRGSVVCLEVGEHIPAQHTDVFLDNVTGHCRNTLLMSWALRGQSGDGHVNCLDNHEAVLLLWDKGFMCDWVATNYLRSLIVSNPVHITDTGKSVWRGHFQNTVLVFQRRT